MSQVVLGLRSLAIKLAIFVVMAALLAWALGGTLFPKPYVADLDDQAVTVNGVAYFWRLTLENRDDAVPQWRFMTRTGNDSQPIENIAWTDAAGPVLADAGVFYGGQGGETGWTLVHLDANAVVARHPMPDRLAVEQQLQRLANGLPLQNASTILAERLLVLDPSQANADQKESTTPAGSD